MAKTIKKSLLMVPNHQCTLCLLILLPFYLFKKGSLGGCCGFLQWLRSGSRISDFMREAAWWALGWQIPAWGPCCWLRTFMGTFFRVETFIILLLVMDFKAYEITLQLSFSQEAKWKGTGPADGIYRTYSLLEQQWGDSIYKGTDRR